MWKANTFLAGKRDTTRPKGRKKKKEHLQVFYICRAVKTRKNTSGTNGELKILRRLVFSLKMHSFPFSIPYNLLTQFFVPSSSYPAATLTTGAIIITRPSPSSPPKNIQYYFVHSGHVSFLLQRGKKLAKEIWG